MDHHSSQVSILQSHSRLIPPNFSHTIHNTKHWISLNDIFINSIIKRLKPKLLACSQYCKGLAPLTLQLDIIISSYYPPSPIHPLPWYFQTLTFCRLGPLPAPPSTSAHPHKENQHRFANFIFLGSNISITMTAASTPLSLCERKFSEK